MHVECRMQKRSSGNTNFFNQVYEVVKEIPLGKVATYGQISTMLNDKWQMTNDVRRINPRTVGWALHGNKNPEIPCHRVVNKEGKVATNYSFGSWKEQKMKLLEEGVKFIDETYVDLAKYIWVFRKSVKY